MQLAPGFDVIKKKNYYTITNPIQFTLVYTCHTPDFKGHKNR